VLGARERVADPVDLAADGVAADVEPAAATVSDEEHDPGVRVVAELLAQQRRRALALGRAVREPRGLEMLLHVPAQRRGEDHEGADEGKDQLRPLPRQGCDPLEHQRPALR
jgi:hypothetical protein